MKQFHLIVAIICFIAGIFATGPGWAMLMLAGWINLIVS